MASPLSNPTIRRRELARRLRELRLAAGKSVDEVAQELMCSAAKVSRMETGERGVQQRDIRDLCRFYGLGVAERDHLMRLAQEAAKRGWWHDFSSMDQQVVNYVALEAAATEIRYAQVLLLPGLLQTAEYTRALLPHLRVPGEMAAEVVEQTVELRARRQQRLLAGEVVLKAVIDESAFRRKVGTARVMLAQLDRLIEATCAGGVTVQVIPFDAGPHPALEGSFQYMCLGDELEDIVFVEGSNGYFLLEDPRQVLSYAQVHAHLSKVALDVEASRAWMQRERDAWAA